MTVTAMQRAVALADAVRARTAPNPWVGCTIVTDGTVIADGATEAPGGRHAEIVALQAAGDRARGATVFVTLEPCCHAGRTGPCTDALIAADVARVIIGIEDPDPQVCGQGIAALRAAGIEVVVGEAADIIAESLAPYLHHRRTGRPWVMWKTAMSLDGRIAAADGTHRWITGEAARHDVQRLRCESQAILIGRGTAIADAPRLTVRDFEVLTPPVRVLVDTYGSTPAAGPLFDGSAPTLVYTASTTDGATWQAAGAEVVGCKHDAHGVDLGAVLDDLGARGVLQVMVEGGARIAASFLAADLVDEIVAYIAPAILGPDALPAVAGDLPAGAADTAFSLIDIARFDDDVRLTYRKST